MKKFTFVSVLLFAFIFTVSAQKKAARSAANHALPGKHIITEKTLSGGFLLTEDLFQEWDGAQWTDVYLTTLIYNASHLEVESVTTEWDGAAWVNYEKYMMTYDAAENLTEMLVLAWDGTQWVNSWRWNYTYTAANLPAESVQQLWDGSVWVNNLKTIMTYNGMNPDQERVQNWSGNWVDSTLTSYTYTGSLETYWFRQLWDGGAWVNDQRANHTYNGNGLLSETFYEMWMSTFWSNMGLRNITYDGTNNILETWKYWDSALGWVNQSKMENSYNANNQQVEQLYYFWINATWENYSRTAYTYDANGNMTEYLWQLWQNGSYVNSMRDLFTYMDITAIGEHTGNQESGLTVTVFPNPVLTSATISYNLPAGDQVTLRIIDASGRTVATLVNGFQEQGTHVATFTLPVDDRQPVPGRGAGIYFYNLKAGSEVRSGRITAIKQ